MAEYTRGDRSSHAYIEAPEVPQELSITMARPASGNIRRISCSIRWGDANREKDHSQSMQELLYRIMSSLYIYSFTDLRDFLYPSDYLPTTERSIRADPKDEARRTLSTLL